MTAAVSTFPQTTYGDLIEFSQIPLSVKEAGLWDFATEKIGEFFVPKDAGPFEMMMRIAEFGAMFVTGGVSNAILFVASLLGIGLQDLGKGIDKFLGIRSLRDLAGASAMGLASKITGYSDADLQRMQAAGQIQSKNQISFFDDMITKIAAEEIIDPSGDQVGIAEPIVPASQEDKEHEAKIRNEERRARTRLPDETEEQYDKRRKDFYNKKHIEELEKKRDRQQAEFENRHLREKMDEDFKKKNKPGIFEPQKGKGVEGKGYGPLKGLMQKVKGWGPKGIIVSALLTVLSWVIMAGKAMLFHPWDNKWRTAGTAAKMVTEDITRGKLWNPQIISPDSKMGKRMEDSRSKVFPHEPKTPSQELAARIDFIISGAE